MPETLLSVLCSEPWRWDSFASSEITFNPDGTGELTCRAELNIWIAAEIEWKAQNAACLQQQISTSQQDAAASLAAGPIEIELTLTKRRIPRFGGAAAAADVSSSGHGINQEVLEDGAFLPKTYTLRLEQGQFHAQSYTPQPGQAPHNTPRFQLRLTFDPSPLPPREEWLRPERAPDSMRFWEWTQFCSRHIGYF
ncbi:hypothetical protein G3M48_009136 [Beauveria asiatica]|uniref:Epoxide hydrolase n=1 Tax=Beauveria asiatica TaxID=1069075 RepID=A0AAW0RJF8_9HYPO